MKARTIAGVVTAFMALVVVATNARQSSSPFIPSGDDSTKVSKATSANSVIDEVVWVVGDEAILKSDIEMMRLQAEQEGMKWANDPDCSIPEQIAVQKLFLHQAAIDSIEVTESEIMQSIEEQLNYWIQMIGSREKLEEYRKQSITQMRQEMHDDFKNRELVQKMRQKLVSDINVSPAEVRNYFKDVPQDSLPLIPTMVEVQIITNEPKVSQDEINRVKNQLREYTDRVNSGETTFATLARLYSEDGSARQGGELGYTPRAALDPAFASVAFNLTDPKKVSKIVETEFGYHIIQLIDRRGERINVRHILMKPRISSESITQAKERLDSVANDIRAGKFTFDDAATYISDDKDTRSNHGLMANATDQSRTSRFRMQDLPTEVARQVERLQVGEISPSFEMINSKGKRVCALIKLRQRTDSHRATITEDFQTMKDVVLAKRREQVLHDWVAEKLKNTYVRMNEQYRGCKFEYEGWVK